MGLRGTTLYFWCMAQGEGKTPEGGSFQSEAKRAKIEKLLMLSCFWGDFNNSRMNKQSTH